LRGIVTVLNTPFTETDAVDYAALARHATRAVEAGVAGFLVPALAAEVGKLTEDERHGMVRTVVETVRRQVPVIGGASAGTQAERLRNAERLAALGCDVVLVSQPYVSQEQYVREIGEIAAASGLPIMIQDWDASGPGVPVPAIAAAFATVDRLKYLKVETADAGQKYTALKRATGGRLHVSGGWAVAQLIEALDRGVDAFMPTALHPVYVGIVDRYRAGDRDAAVALFRRVLPILAFANQNLELSIHFFKHLLWRQGLYPTPRLRAPASCPDEYQRRVMDELVELAVALEDEVMRDR
jgi:dihydrodipicolinate synthase/N-acetylneuraminate lyase